MTPLLTLLAHLGATRLHPCATLFAGQRTVAVGVQPGEGLGRLALSLGDDDGEPAFAVATHALGSALHPAAMTATGVFCTRSTLAATGPLAVGARRLELGPADGAVLVRVQTVEHGGAALGPLGLTGSAHFLSRDRAVAVGVGGAQTLHPALDEVSLRHRLSHSARRPLRGCGLRDGHAAENGQNGDGGDPAKGLVHLDGLRGPQPENIPVEK